MNNSILIYTDTLRVLDELSDEQSGRLFRCVKAYFEGDKDTMESLLADIVIRVAFVPFRESFDRNRKKYEAVCERNRKNGEKGGRPKETKENPENPVGFSETQQNPKNLDSDSDSDSKSDSDSDSKCDRLSSYEANPNHIIEDANASTSSHDDAQLVLTPPEEPKGRKKDYSLNVMSFWNNSVKGANVAMPTIAKMTDRRKAVVNARVSEYGINKVYQAISKAVESTFLNGGGSRGFIADFDWVMRPNNFPKVLEGSYSNNGGTAAINMNQDGNVQQPRSREQREADLRNKERLGYLSKKYGDIG